jgi:SAM-dependent methyltransferase
MIRATTAHRSVHVGHDDVIERTARCPICGDEGARRPVVLLQNNPDIRLLVCRRCHGASASHMPTAGFLQRYYARYHEGRGARVTFADSARFAKHITDLLPRVPTRILDFGGGDGTLSVAVAQRLLETTASIDITVIDWSEPVVTPDSRIRIDAARTIGERADEYDLIIASAVLEHIPDLQALLPQLTARIRPGGLLYARTPYIVPLRRVLPVDVGYPAHVHDLGRDFWDALPTWLPAPLRTLLSRPSLVAASWRRQPLRALAAHLMKFPTHVSRRWPFVGGWEVIMERTS